jgi:hypothetical protein
MTINDVLAGQSTELGRGVSAPYSWRSLRSGPESASVFSWSGGRPGRPPPARRCGRAGPCAAVGWVRRRLGQAAALAELRAVTMTRAAATHLAIKPRRRRRVGLAAVAVAGALATGGVAAAATGHLPEPVRKATRSILVTVGSGEPASTVPHPASSAQLPGSGRTGQPRPPTGATVPAHLVLPALPRPRART